MAFIPHGHPDREKNLARFLDGNHEEVPDVAFHGTMDDFSQFKYESPTRVSRGLNRLGFWFDKNEKTPNYFAGYAQPSESRKPNVIAAHISMKNPLIFASDEIHPELQDKINEMAKRQDWYGINGLLAQKGHDDAFDKLMRLLPNGGRTRNEVVDQIRQKLMDDGYDGIILKNTMADHQTRGGRPTDWYLPFRSEQIKSAFGNQGTFDPNDPDITKAEGGGVIPHGHPQREENLSDWNKDNKLVDEQGNPLVLYRGAVGHEELPEGFLQGKTRGKYATFTSTSPYLASTYANPDPVFPSIVGGVMPIHAHAHKLHEFPTKGTRFDMFAFDDFARRLPKGHAVVARQVLDLGPRTSLTTDPEMKYSRPSDIYAWNEANSIKSATGNRGTFDPNDPDITKAGGGEVEPEGDWELDLSDIPEERPGITGYHGSPYDFDRFDLSRAGTGEGAAAYGHGVYTAEHPDVARGYRDTLTEDHDMLIGNEPIGEYYAKLENRLSRMPADQAEQGYNQLALIEDLMHGGDLLHIRENAKQGAYDPSAVEWFEREIAPKFQRKGRLYEVHIDAHPQEFLDWDNDLNHRNNSVVGDMLPGVKHYDRAMNDHEKSPTGAEFYESLVRHAGSHEAASRLLHQAGIKGIRYLDEDSRGGGTGTKNYVVFDDKLINVKRKYADGGVVKEASGSAEPPKQPAKRKGRASSVIVGERSPIVDRALMLVSRKA